MNEVKLKFPIGKFSPREYHFRKEIDADILILDTLIPRIEYLIMNQDTEALNHPYRQGGWNTIQVINHLADSHMMAFARLKMALVIDNPTIMPYPEHLFVQTSEVTELPFNNALTLLHALHQRWVILWKSMSDEDYHRTYFHPEHQKLFTLAEVLQIYAWHSEHHLTHIQSAIMDYNKQLEN